MEKEDVLKQIQDQAVEYIQSNPELLPLKMPDLNYILKQCPEMLETVFKVKSLLVACAKDPEIRQSFAPQKMSGQCGAVKLSMMTNVPQKGTLEESAHAIIAYKNANGIDALVAEDAFITKQALQGPRARAGVGSGAEVFREQLAYTLQKAINVDFGVPPTVAIKLPIGSKQKWSSCQSFIKGCKQLSTLTDADIEKIPPEEFHKLIFDVILFSLDRISSNALITENHEIILIDNGLSMPDQQLESLNGLREAQMEWMGLPQAKMPVDPEGKLGKAILEMDIDQVIEKLRLSVEEMEKESGRTEDFNTLALEVIHLTLLISKIGVEEKVPLREIAATIAPFREKGPPPRLRGGELLSIYKNNILEKEKINWKEIENIIKLEITKPINKREQHSVAVFLRGYTGVAAEVDVE